MGGIGRDANGEGSEREGNGGEWKKRKRWVWEKKR